MKLALLLPLPLLLAASGFALAPGEYEVSSTPGQATLNGKPLGDLPYTPSEVPERVCLTPASAGNPVALIRRQVPAGCAVVRVTRSRQGVTLAGGCRPQSPGLARGSFRLSANWANDSYQVRFATHNPSENGRMGFTGRVDARRVGACPT